MIRLKQTWTSYFGACASNRGIHAGVIISIFAHLHTALRIEEGNMIDMC